MIETTGKEARTTTPETHRLRRRTDAESYFTRCTLLPGETADDFEEVPLEDVPTEEEQITTNE